MLNTVATALAALVLPLSGMLWLSAVRRRSAGHSLLPYEPRASPVWGLSDVLLALFFQMLAILSAAEWLRGYAGIELGPGYETLGLEQQGQVMFALAVSRIIALLGIVLWLQARHRPAASDWGFNRRQFGADVRIGLAAFLMLAPLVYGLQWLLAQVIESKHPLLELLKSDPNPRFFAIAGFAAVLVAPFDEEFFYRLILQGWLERAALRWDHPWPMFFGGRKTGSPATNRAAAAADTAPPTGLLLSKGDGKLAESPLPDKHADGKPAAWPIVVSALLFALAHMSHGPDPIPLFLFALGLGYVYRQTHRLVPCIVLHALLNSCTMGMAWLAVHS